jgi:hypothetical protein
MNFRRMRASIETVVNSSVERDSFTTELNTYKFNDTGHLYAVLAKIFVNDKPEFIAPNGVSWDDQSQDQRDFTTIYSHIRKSQDLKKKT